VSTIIAAGAIQEWYHINDTKVRARVFVLFWYHINDTQVRTCVRFCFILGSHSSPPK
jgi:hypothetical protein